MMESFSISREGFVRDRKTGRELGMVQPLEFPRQADDVMPLPIWQVRMQSDD